MKIISGTTEFHIDQKSVVAIGKFDGVHLGHQKLLGAMSDWKALGYPAVVFTFDRPPASIFAPDRDCGELTTLAEKQELMEQMGADVLVEFPMTVETAAIPAETFVEEILVKQMNSAVILAGEDISFGHQGRGNRKLLETMAPQMGYQLRIVDKLLVSEVSAGLERSLLSENRTGSLKNTEGSAESERSLLSESRTDSLKNTEACHDEKLPVSSSLIRELLEQGKMEQVALLCGRPYSVTGPIIHGKHLGGPVLHMPTINMAWPAGKLAPPFGVYYSRTLLEGKYYDSITNVGCKPTVSSEKQILAETYIYDFDQDAYGEKARVFFYGYKRAEQKFDGIEALREQMQLDIRQGARYWGRQ